ncbi:hypothetical protein ACOSP7_023071 [Xanthoceras sorbifolium]
MVTLAYTCGAFQFSTVPLDESQSTVKYTIDDGTTFKEKEWTSGSKPLSKSGEETVRDQSKDHQYMLASNPNGGDMETAENEVNEGASGGEKLQLINGSFQGTKSGSLLHLDDEVVSGMEVGSAAKGAERPSEWLPPSGPNNVTKGTVGVVETVPSLGQAELVFDSSPMEGVNTDSSPIAYSATKWKKMARNKHVLSPSSPVQKLLFARRRTNMAIDLLTKNLRVFVLWCLSLLMWAAKERLTCLLWWIRKNFSCFDLINWLYRNISRKEFEFVCVLLWYLWFDRNSFMHDGVLKPPASILEIYAILLNEYQDTVKIVFVQNKVVQELPQLYEILS